MFCNGLLEFLRSKREEAATEEAQVRGFLTALNLQEFLYFSLREAWRSPHVFKVEAMSNAISSSIFESEIFQNSEWTRTGVGSFGVSIFGMTLPAISKSLSIALPSHLGNLILLNVSKRRSGL